MKTKIIFLAVLLLAETAGAQYARDRFQERERFNDDYIYGRAYEEPAEVADDAKVPDNRGPANAGPTPEPTDGVMGGCDPYSLEPGESCEEYNQQGAQGGR